MNPEPPPNRLDRPVDEAYDHTLGPADAEITLVEYGSYADVSSRSAHERVAELRSRFGNRMRYVFRHRPLAGSKIARRAAELVESYDDPTRLWNLHVALMSRSDKLNADDLRTIISDLKLDGNKGAEQEAAARDRVDADIASADASGVTVTPTFFINDRRYDGPWDVRSLSEAMLGSLGRVVHAAALDFAKWAPSTGIMLLLATGLAVILSNSAFGPDFNEMWEQRLGITFQHSVFELSLRHWINDGLLVIFFLVVGLEIKREFTVGHLAGRQSAMLPGAKIELSGIAGVCVRECRSGCRDKRISEYVPLMLGTATALVIGKPLGFITATVTAVQLGFATKPDAYSWRQLGRAGALAGIGFTMSLFIASQAFSEVSDYAAAKIAIFGGSILSAVIGIVILWNAQAEKEKIHERE